MMGMIRLMLEDSISYNSASRKNTNKDVRILVVVIRKVSYILSNLYSHLHLLEIQGAITLQEPKPLKMDRAQLCRTLRKNPGEWEVVWHSARKRYLDQEYPCLEDSDKKAIKREIKSRKDGLKKKLMVYLTQSKKEIESRGKLKELISTKTVCKICEQTIPTKKLTMHNGPCRKNNDILNELQEINKWLIAACSRAKDLKSEITERIAIKRKKGAKISGADTPNLKSSKENRFLNTSSNRKNEDDDDQTSSQLNDSRTSGLAFNGISPSHSFSKPEPQKAQTKIDLKVDEKPANSGSGHTEQEVITIGVFSGESGGVEKSEVPNGKHSKGSAQNENISTESDESEIDDGDKFDSRGKANYSKFRVYMKSPDPEQRSQVNSSPNLTAPEPVVLPPTLVQDQPKVPATAGPITSSITGIVIRNEKNEEDDRPAVGDGLFDSEEEASGRGDEDGLSFTSDAPVAAPPMKMSAFGQAAKQEVEQKQQPAKPAPAPVVEKVTMLSNPTSPSHATSALNQLKGIESLSPKHKKTENKSADSDPCFGDMVGMSDSEDDDPPPKKNEPVKKSGFSIEAKPQPPAVAEPEPPRPELKSEQKAITMTNKQADALPNPPDFMAMLDDGSDKDTSSIDDRAGKEKIQSVNNDEPEQPVLRQTESSIASYSFDASKRFSTKDNGEKQRAESVQPSKVDLHDEKKEADRKAQVLENLAKFKNSSNKQQFKTFIDHPKTDMSDQDKAAEKQEMEILKTANQYFTKIAEYVEHVQTHPDSGYHTDKQMKEFLKSIIENESFPIHDIKETAKEILAKVEKRIELIQMRSVERCTNSGSGERIEQAVSGSEGEEEPRVIYPAEEVRD